MAPKFSRVAPSSAYIRTDLACESPVPAASAEEETVSAATRPVTLTRRTEADGGFSVTLSLGRITERGESELPDLSRLLARELWDMATRMMGREPDGDTRILVAGLGNDAMTPDAIGPETLRRMTVTRHLRGYDESLFAALGCCELAAISPGVLGQTGMESGELVRCAAGLVKPHLVVRWTPWRRGVWIACPPRCRSPTAAFPPARALATIGERWTKPLWAVPSWGWGFQRWWIPPLWCWTRWRRRGSPPRPFPPP